MPDKPIEIDGPPTYVALHFTPKPIDLRTVRLCNHLSLRMYGFDGWEIGDTITTHYVCGSCDLGPTTIRRTGENSFEKVDHA